MSKTSRYLLVTSWIIFSRAYDAYSSVLFTPDLSKESNPLASVAGLQWTPILIIVSVLTLYCIYAFYLSIFKPKNLFPEEKGLRPSEFAGYLYFGRKMHWIFMLFMLPSDLKRFNRYMGATLTPCIAFAGIVSTVMWLLIKYTDFYKEYHSATLIYSILLIGSAMIMIVWNYRQYKQYQQITG